MRYFLAGFILLVVALVGVAGFRGGTSRRPPIEVFPDMDRQPKLRPQTDASFFEDGLSSRLFVPGTVARGTPYQDLPVNTGMITGTTNFVPSIPLEVNPGLMARGRERYDIYCSPCHGLAADGKGITTKYGMAIIANLHDKRIVEMPDGELFHIITQGKNNMGAYGATIPIQDRWAIIAYTRALQRSRLAAMDEIPPAARSALKK